MNREQRTNQNNNNNKTYLVITWDTVDRSQKKRTRRQYLPLYFSVVGLKEGLREMEGFRVGLKEGLREMDGF